MTTSTLIETHELIVSETDMFARAAGFKFYGECSCHNPDGNGDGRQDYFASTVEELEDMHYEHRSAQGMK